MWKFLLFCVILGVMDSSSGVQRNKKRYVRAGSSAGSFAGSSGTGGYVGNYGDYDYDGGDFGYAPNYGFIDPYQFHQQLTAQIAAQHAAINNAIAASTTTGDATVFADASYTPDNIQIQQQAAKEHFDSIRRRNHYNNNGYKPNRYAPNYAAASGSTRPGGFYQTAYISPANAAQPNIVNRFSASSSPSGGNGGFQGVSVSSFSSSSDVDGKRTSHRGAQTTVNDNGKITTYKVQS